MGEQNVACLHPRTLTQHSATGWTKSLTGAVTERSRNILLNEESNTKDRILEFYSKLIFSSDIKKNFFWLHHAACGILGARLGIKPVPAALEVQSLKR